jgi:hypothetical protein
MKPAVLGAMFLLFAGPAAAASDDLEQSYENLKNATARKDVAQVKKLAVETSALARQVQTAPAPENNAENWPKYVAFARDVELYTEYALYATAVQSPPAALVDLLSTLEQQNPKSKYLDDGYGAYFLALRQSGAANRILGVAGKAIAHFPDNEDLLLFLADSAMARRQFDRASAYSERLVAVLKRHTKPEPMPAAEWERKRAASLGVGYWIAGMCHCEKQQYPQADEDLKAALPLIQSNTALLAPALFQLSLANYQLGKLTMNRGRVLEAARYAEQVAGMKTELAQQAWTNAHLMQQEATRMARGGR